jgi:Tfp pilus assembly protein FimT
MTSRRNVRIGFTLIELLTVIGIIVTLLALTAIFYPNFNNQSTVASGADNTSGALLIAKMRAKRDGRPTGLRLPLPINILSATETGTTVTISTGNAPGLTGNGFVSGQKVAIDGITPSGYTGQYTITTTGPNSFTYTAAPNLGIANLTGASTATTLAVTQLTVIQQPDDYAVGRYSGPLPNNNPQTTPQTATFSGGANFMAIDLTTGMPFVNPGDYLELNGGGLLYQIVGVPSTGPGAGTTLTLADSITFHPLPTITTDVNVNFTLPTTTTIPTWGTNYRIIRAPQPLIAEPPINLPTGVIIDLAVTNGQTVTQGITYHPGNNYILFAPSGAVVGGNTTGPVFLVLRQPDGSNVVPYGADPAAGLTAYFATVISVAPRTGFIAANPVAPGNNPYAYTQDGLSSGM